MGITNKAISTKFLNIIIRTNHGQTEIVMQYGGLRSSVACVATSCINESFASQTHRTNKSLYKGLWDVVPPVHKCVMQLLLWFWWMLTVYRAHPINVRLVTDPVIMPAKEEHGCDSGSESLDKHHSHDILHCHVERRDQSFAVAERTERKDQEYRLCILRHSMYLEQFWAECDHHDKIHPRP